MSDQSQVAIELVVGDDKYSVTIPSILLTEAEDFFRKVDSDMDRGWQMSRRWVGQPNTLQRCQIMADRILTALHKDNQKMIDLAVAYILTRMPGITQIDIDIEGDITQTEFL